MPAVDSRVQRWSVFALWLAASIVGVLDLLYVYRTWWMGSDFQPTVLAVSSLFHHTPIVHTYVYPPGFLIIASPLILLPHGEHSAALLMVLEVLGLAFTFRTMWRLTDRPLFSATAAGLALALALSGQVIYVFQLENLTLMLLPFAAGFYALTVSKHWLAAGAVLGISLTIKPMLIPLVLLLLLEKQWKAFGISVGIPVVTSALALAVSYQPGHFFHAAVGVLSGNDHVGGSIDLSGIGTAWHVNGFVVGAVRVLVVVFAVVVIQRIWTSNQPLIIRYVWTGESALAALLLSFEFTHSFYALLLLPASVVGLAAGGPRTRRLTAISTLLILLPVWLVWVGRWPGSRPQASLLCLGMLLFLGAAATLGNVDTEVATSPQPIAIPSS